MSSVPEVSDQELAARIHQTAGLGAIVLSSGGSGALALLLRTPGASRTILEAQIPYGEAALHAYLGGVPDQACAPDTARAMAMAAFHRARTLSPAATFGVSCTASLATDRPKRGAHRIYIGLQTERRSDLFSVELNAGERDRAGEEAICDRLLLNALAEAKGIATAAPPRWYPGETLQEARCEAPAHWQALVLGEQRAIEAHRAEPPAPDTQPRLIFPGAFNPIHGGHLGMAEVAEELTGLSVEFELCIRNVDKPPLNYAAIAERLEQIPASHRVWLTAAPTFVEKAGLFSGATFMLGIDTLERIADPRYYGGDPETRDRAITRIGALGCRFLVFGRSSGNTFVSVADLSLPRALTALVTPVPEQRFRRDLSSSDLRKQGRDGHPE